MTTRKDTEGALDRSEAERLSWDHVTRLKRGEESGLETLCVMHSRHARQRVKAEDGQKNQPRRGSSRSLRS